MSQTGRRRPTHTVIVPDALTLAQLVSALIAGQLTFTCEPGHHGTWHLGLMQDGVDVVNELFGPAVDIGTFGEHFPEKFS